MTDCIPYVKPEAMSISLPHINIRLVEYEEQMWYMIRANPQQNGIHVLIVKAPAR